MGSTLGKMFLAVLLALSSQLDLVRASSITASGYVPCSEEDARAAMACKGNRGTSIDEKEGVFVDLKARCMCLPAKAFESNVKDGVDTQGDASKRCFYVGIGKNGEQMTTNGVSEQGLHPSPGKKYPGTDQPGTKDYDKDGIAMDIPSNDGPGKWLHKPPNCGTIPKGGKQHSLGCITIPCDYWPNLKSLAIGENKKKTKIAVCGGSDRGSAGPHAPVAHSAETALSEDENKVYKEQLRRKGAAKRAK